MLYAAVIIILLWMFGLVSGYTASGFFLILLVIAVIMGLLRLFEGRKALG